ncbi:MAG: hypothetical protein K6G56_07090 [Clostridiales bacterium]|nr:hypothetical protein [Clostridiales bacterium]
MFRSASITINDLPVISTKEQLEKAVSELGFLPFFDSGIRGFSLKDHIDPAVWFADGVDGPWEWKTEVGVYGKLMRGKAVFMAPEWYGLLACYRRDGYDFEGMYEDGFLPHASLPIMNELEKGSVLSTELRRRTGMEGKGSGFDGIVNLLQMKCFVLPVSFEYAFDRRGLPYGWGLARYALSDTKYGSFIDAAEKEFSPAEAKELLIGRVMELCPEASRKQAERLIK